MPRFHAIILSPVLGGYVDGFLKDGGTPQDALKNVAGVQFTIISGILLASTFIPAGTFALNPLNCSQGLLAPLKVVMSAPITPRFV